MLYFAYGSNLDKAEMARRCKSAKDEGVACLKGYRLDFTRYSANRGGAVADVVEEEGCAVWGVVYEISEEDCRKLDRCEGYDPDRAKGANSYNRKIIEVFEKGNSNKPKKVSIYIANREPDPGLPSQEYLDYILRGARDRCSDFPPSYIEMLEQVETL
tara:strand:- start:1921 stop:2394 length:474 start_codon:yes stop_codon:yes gene_type:complete